MICNADSRRQWLTSPCLMHLFMVYSCIFWLIHGEPPKSRVYTFVPQWAQRSLTSQNRSLSWNQVASGRSETGDEGTAVFHQLWRDHSDVLANVYRNAIRLDASDPCHSKSLRPIITSCGAIPFFFAFGIIWQQNWGHRFCSAATFAKNWGHLKSSWTPQNRPIQLGFA